MLEERRDAAAGTETRPATDGSPGPLEGVRIIEIGQLLAGPFAGHLLADFGAELIKVELPGAGDPMREWGHHRYKDRALWWPSLARNKKSVTLNLREERGRELFRELVDRSDALLENFRPGTLERWGLGPENLQQTNPGLVVARVSGFGQTGPYADRAGFASVGEAMGGLRYVNGYPDQPPPRAGISLGDSLAGMFAVQGMLMSLYWRDVGGSGRGQVVDSSILESCFALLEGSLTEYDLLGEVRQPSGTGLRNVAPSNIYRSRDGQWMVIAANADRIFERLCTAMEMPELAEDERFATHAARGDNAEELDGIISDWAAKHESGEIDRVLNEAGVVCGPIYSIADIYEDPHFQARGMIREAHDPEIGPLRIPGFVPRLTETPGDLRWTGPARPGEHNREVLGQVLGLSDTEIDQLRGEGIV